MSTEAETLRAVILARHKTLYAFCGAVGLPRGTVYQVIRGRYAGNHEKQLARIRAALEAPRTDRGAEEKRIMKALAKTACARCGIGKRRCRKIRHLCQELWEAQAAAVVDRREVRA